MAAPNADAKPEAGGPPPLIQQQQQQAKPDGPGNFHGGRGGGRGGGRRFSGTRDNRGPRNSMGGGDVSTSAPLCCSLLFITSSNLNSENLAVHCG